MNIHRILYFILCVGIIMGCNDETSDFGLTNTFVKFYGDANENTGVKALPTLDGGYIVAGSTSYGEGIVSSHIFKTNELGNETWSLVVDTTTPNIIKDVLLEDDGSYVFLADKSDYDGNDFVNFDIMIIRVSAEGAIVSTNLYDSDGTGNFNERGNGITKTADGGYVVIGFTNNTTSGDLDMYVIRLDASLTVVWDKIYGNISGLADRGKSIIEDSNGDLVWLGTEEVSTSDTRIRMVKTNSLGNILWDFNYPVVESNTIIEGTGSAGDFMQLGGGYVFTGSHSTRGIVMAKVDRDGQQEWFQQFTQGGQEEGRAITLAGDNTLVVAGKSSGGNQSDMIVLKTDIQGTFIWSNTFGGTGLDEANSVAPTTDNGVVVAGLISFDVNKMMTLTKINKDGITSE